jgi:hypothetical protein
MMRPGGRAVPKEALKPNKTERRLIEAAVAACAIEFATPATVRAKVLRALLLGLPVGGKIWAVSPIGFRVRNARIEGRLHLDNARSPQGSALPPMELAECVFDGGFSGAHGHFSRLCFTGSSFGGRHNDSHGAALPSVDLTNARIESSLALRGVKPDSEDDFLWISLVEARVDGGIDLSQCRLRAPDWRKARPAEHEGPEALSLTLAQVKGDIEMMGGAQVEGRISGRRAIVRGDIWMCGTKLEVAAPPGSQGKAIDSLFLQSAEVGGLLMLDGDENNPFRAWGRLNLNDLQLGGTLSLSNVRLAPPLPCDETEGQTAEPDDRGDGDEGQTGDDDDRFAQFTCVSLREASIGDSVQIAIAGGERSRIAGALRLPNAKIAGSLTVCDLYVGMPVTGPSAGATLHAPLLQARSVCIGNVEPLLWDAPPSDAATDVMALSVNLAGAKLDSLTVSDSWINRDFDAPIMRTRGDVVLDARIEGRVNLEAAEIGGSLDISELRLDGSSSGLNLREARINRALRLTPDRTPANRLKLTLIEVRRVDLAALPGLSLIEAIWRRDAGDGRSRHYQAGFLQRGERLFLLDGTAATFDSIVGHFRGTSLDPRVAEELMRLYCTYVRDRNGLRILLPTPEEVGRAPDDPDAAADKWLRLVASATGEEYKLRATALSERGLIGQWIRLRLKGDRVVIEFRSEKRLPQGAGRAAPQVDQHFILTAPGEAASADRPWVAPCPIEGSQRLSPDEARNLDSKLRALVETRASLHGTVNLEGAICEMLDDNSGRCWGTPDRIEMNHFVYRRTVWMGRDREPSRGWLDWAKVELARRAPLGWARRYGWLGRRLEARDRCSDWRARLHWIYRQYDTKGLDWPCSYRIRQSEYAPQPFEQAVAVCRSEGREDYALHFEIEKQRIEWNLVSRRNRPWGFLFGILVALGWVAMTQITRSPHRHQLLVPVLLVLGIGLASDLANIALSVMFGYLRRPMRAIASLAFAFILGWQGVYYANRHQLMAVAAEPVATVALPAGRPVRMGVQLGRAEPRVACGEEISEPLYALDVLIPLIDLRQENRCDIASVPPLQKGMPRPPFYRSERFWAWLKALYAIAGWFIVSLAILTFAQANRTKIEEAG